MSGSWFVDTNVLVYGRDASEPIRQPAAAAWLQRLWTDRTGRLSTQVLQEYYVTVTRKLRPGLSRAHARQDVVALLAWNPIATDERVLRRAFELEDRFSLSWWDAAIVSAALTLGCRALLTEDLQDGLDIDGLAVVNPFLHAP